MGAITTIANLLKHSNSANELQNKIFKKLESKSGFQKADFAISLLYKDDFVDLVAPVYIQEGLEWMKSYLDSNGTEMENNIDFQVDETLEKCILSTPRKSFFLFCWSWFRKDLLFGFFFEKNT